MTSRTARDARVLSFGSRTPTPSPRRRGTARARKPADVLPADLAAVFTTLQAADLDPEVVEVTPEDAARAS